MRAARRSLIACALFASTLACTDRDASSHRERGTLPEGIAARVGDDEVALITVARIAAAQGLSAAAARESAIVDALFAAGARADAARRPAMIVAERGVLARAVLEALWADARKDPPTDAEVDALTRERWVELDRPVSVKTTHAVVRVSKPEERSAALAVARKLQEAVAGVRDPNEFVTRAAQLSTPELEVRAERLPFVTPDGRTFNPAETPEGHPEPLGRFDTTFARAANAIAEPGDQSPIVETMFGFHVILLEKRLAARQPELAERREVLSVAVWSKRAERSLAALEQRLHAATPVEASRDAETLTALVRATP